MPMDQSARIKMARFKSVMETSVPEEITLYFHIFLKERHQWVLPSSPRIEEDEPILISESVGPVIEKKFQMPFRYLWFRNPFISTMFSSINFLQPHMLQILVNEISEFSTNNFADPMLPNQPKMIKVIATIEVFTKEEYVMPWIDALKVKILEINYKEAEDESEEVCSICLEKFTSKNEVAEMPCAHIFHKPCVVQWLVKKSSCPVCRFEI